MAKAILVITKGDLKEMLSLCSSIGIEVVSIFRQRSPSDPRYYIGRGKVEEIKKACEVLKPDYVILDGDLRGSQIYNLQKELGAEILDRKGLLLKIFEKKAGSPEAKLQVELANIRYQLPLIREYISMAKRGEHPGYMGGGEYAVADYYEMLKRRERRIKEKLKKIRRRNQEKLKRRGSLGMITVAIAGYANAGKSSIAKALTGYDLPIDDKMFSTIAVFTKKVRGRHPIMITDTVGFVKDFPMWMIEAFRATFENIYNSDLTLLVVDVSEEIDEISSKMASSYEILGEKPKILVVLNKIDLLSKEELRERIEELKRRGLLPLDRYVPVSAKTGEGIQELILKIYEVADTAVYCVLETREEEIPQEIFEKAYIAKVEPSEEDLRLYCYMHRSTFYKLRARGYRIFEVPLEMKGGEGRSGGS